MRSSRGRIGSRSRHFVVELDGWAAHKTRHAFVRDRRQDAEILAVTGMPTVRLPYDDTTQRAQATAERLRQILRRAELRSD